jgi:formylglycine-generating enzyme required for sulfatase activity
LAPLALWLRQENPTAGLVSRDQIEDWLTRYYHGEEWELPKGEARQRGREFLESVQRYSNLLLERGEGQYGFLHLTLEEMLAAKGIAQLFFDDREAALEVFQRYLLDPGWQETLQLAVGVVGVIKQQPKSAGSILQHVMGLAMPADASCRQVVFAGEAALDIGSAGVSRPAARAVQAALAQAMQAADCRITTRRDAGDLLGRLGWLPEPGEDDLLLFRTEGEPIGLDVFRPVPRKKFWIGKYPVTNCQFARFMEDDGYERREFWGDAGRSWRSGSYDSKAPDYLQEWLKQRPPQKRNRPFFWRERRYNSPLFPVVGVSWFEAEAYARWLTARLRESVDQISGPTAAKVKKGVADGKLLVRLPLEAEWEAAVASGGEFSWGENIDFYRLNCADSWAGRKLTDVDEHRKWWESEGGRTEAGPTAVTTFPQGASPTGVWDGSGNVWEWMNNLHTSGEDRMALRGGSWYYYQRTARVSNRFYDDPGYCSANIGFRVVVAPIL